jgi:hypothetical protein
MSTKSHVRRISTPAPAVVVPATLAEIVEGGADAVTVAK